MFRILKRNDESSVRIPLGDDGYVPFGELEARHRARPQRAQRIDDSRTSKVVESRIITPEKAVAWRTAPGRSDIEGFDVPAKQQIIIPPAKADVSSLGGFFSGLKPRRSAYGDLPWLSDPELAEAMARNGDFSPDMAKAYADGAYDDYYRRFMGGDEMDSFNEKRGSGPLVRHASYSMDHASYFYSQETGKNYTATPQGIAMYADDLARKQNGVDRDGLKSHVRNMMDDTRVIRSHGAHDVLRVGGSNFSRNRKAPVRSNNPRRDSKPAFASAETGAEYPLTTAGIKKYLEDYDEWVGMLSGRTRIAKWLKDTLPPVPGYAVDVDIADLHDSLEVLR